MNLYICPQYNTCDKEGCGNHHIPHKQIDSCKRKCVGAGRHNSICMTIKEIRKTKIETLNLKTK